MIDLGRVRPGRTINIPFGSYTASTGASSATTNFAAGDVQIYKATGGVANTTQRASSSGITASTDFDATGENLVTIDLSDNTTAGFYSSGSEYIVFVADVTIDGQTVRFPLARFTIGFTEAVFDTTIATLTNQTSFTLTNGSADNNAYAGCVVYISAIASAIQCAMGTISAYTGASKTVTLAVDPAIYTIAAGDNISIFPRHNVYSVGGTAQTAGDIVAAEAVIAGYIDTEVAAIKAVTDQLPNGGALSNLDAAISSRATPAQILTTALTEAYANLHAAPTLAQLLFEVRALLAEKSVAATTLTAKKIDGATTAETFTLNDATTPTAITRAS